ncbi:MAG TPA: adenylate/guanylate cyclase domain-containing protein [Candidatus Cloacimonadota bacterium]|nr:adenylate/guanylate cyclase domain-containing protein [Candidatus Cloacimonadota bacterium]
MQDDLILDSGFFGFEEDNLNRKQKHQLREGELREVTILFADIKGFTDLSSQLDPETVHLRMDELMKIFSRCVTFYGGFVDKYIGDAIMALFGAKQASEHDTERAIRAALKMIEQLKRYNEKLKEIPKYKDVELRIRVGINTGVVSVGKVGQSREGDFTVYGPEVNLASRMETNAPVGRIMLSQYTKELVDDVFDFEYLGVRELKGIAEQVECWSPFGVSAAGSSQLKRFSGSFLGRSSELSLLNGALEEISSQGCLKEHTTTLPPPRPIIYGIKAEAGLGKSRLAYEFVQSHLGRAEFLDAACDGVSPTPLHLFARLVQKYFGINVGDEPQARLTKLKSRFVDLQERVDKELAEQLDDAFAMIAWLLEIRVEDARLQQAGEELLKHLLMALNATLEAIMQSCDKSGKPLVLILDDLQWLDDISKELLGNLVSRISQSKLPSLWLLFYRPSFEVPGFLKRMRGWQELELNPLDEHDITELMMLYTRQLALSERSIEAVVKLAAGNPFYLEEWCNYVSTLPEQEWQDLPVPSSLNALIQSRLDSLPKALRSLLQKAAVIGQEFLVEVLRELERSLDGSTPVEEGLNSLEKQALIIPQPGFEYSAYFFKHITTRDVAYHSLLGSNRKLLHQLVAEAIQSVFPARLDEFSHQLAMHFLKADKYQEALPWLRKAASNAQRAYDNSMALKLYQTLLDILPADDYKERAEVLLNCLEIKWLIGDWKDIDEAMSVLQKWNDQAQDNSLRFHQLRFSGSLAFQRGQRDVAKEYWDRAEQLAKEADDPELICVIENLLGIWYYYQLPLDESLSRHQHSKQLARSLQNHTQEAKSINNIGLVYLEQQKLDEAQEAFRQSMELAAEHRILKVESEAMGNLAYVLIQTGKYDDAIFHLSRQLQYAQQINDKLESIRALGNMADAYKCLKRYQDAAACLEHIIKIKQYLGDEEGIKGTSKFLKEILELEESTKTDFTTDPTTYPTKEE